MVKGLIGKKVEMTQTFDEHGRVMPVTKIRISPNFVVQIKQTDKDGYASVQLGSERKKKTTKPLIGHTKKAGLEFVPRHIREIEFDGELKSGQEITLDQVFKYGALVDITGVSKGKGFAGVVKRWGFAGGPRTHGQSDRERHAGSIGATTTPGRVFKGMKMAGHLGNRQVTVRGLEIVKVDKDGNELWVSGSVPGANSSVVVIRKSKKKRRAYHEPEIPTAPQVGGAKEGAPESEEKTEVSPTE
ncbi:50S ribosomal protein L3 [Patescibacteria group bacterium]|nr:50S ribosomal protein L3 [Patescibacteria group bacterium]